MKFEESLRFGLLFKLSDKDRLALCQQIADACEQSYRRGFHHGYEGAGEVTVDVTEWRFHEPLNYSPSPHGTYEGHSLIRHAHEVGLPIQESQPVE